MMESTTLYPVTPSPFPSGVPFTDPRAAYHAAQFYEDDHFLVESVTAFAATGLKNAQGVILLATSSHLEAIAQALVATGLDVASFQIQGQLVLLDADEVLARVMSHGLPDPALFRPLVGDLLARLFEHFASVRIYGEAVNVLWSEGNLVGTLALEEEWNQLAKQHPFQLLCGYHLTRFNKGIHQIPFEAVCESHGHVWPAEGYSQLTDPQAQLRAIARLQQRAQALEKEVEERKGIEEELKHKAAELTRSNEELQRFMFAASHDLKEPIRMVVSFLQLIEKKGLAATDRQLSQFIQFAVEGAQRMANLVDGLVNHARVESHPQPGSPVDCNTIFEEALANLQVAIRGSAAQVTRDQLPAVAADPVQVLQLFQNLISNGIKFHNAKCPKVHVAVEFQPVQRRWLFSVTDNGIGIAPEYHERIFGLFQRLHSRDQYAGSGIGLATCKKIVESMGGCIWVESEPHRGSTFRFTLPAV